MEEEPTCGKGLAENSVLPAKLGDLTAALAEVLEVHTKALDRSDENSRQERDVYLDLVKQHREIAARLQATARQMAGYRDLPMGRHDEAAMSGPEPLAVFERFVKLEQELLALLQSRVEQHRQMLGEMGGGG
jgi:hypothetical protein